MKNYRLFYFILYIIFFYNSLTAQTNKNDNVSQQIILTPQEKEFIQNNPSVIIANDTTYPPMDFSIEGKPTGYSIDLLEMLLHKLGMKASYDSSDDWESLVEKFKNKQIDILTSISPTEEDKEYTIYSNRYLTAPNVLYIRKSDKSIKNAFDLEEKIVALPADYEDLDDLKKYGIHVKHLEVEDMYEAMEAVATGKADATIGSWVVLKYIVDKEGHTGLKELQNIYGEEESVIHGFFFGIQKDKPILKNLLNKAMDTITIQEKRALNEKWLEPSENKNIEFTVQEETYLNNKEYITMCVDPNWMPYEKIDENGKYIGIASEILDLVQKRSNIKFKIVPTNNWKESLNATKNRKCDIVSLVMKTNQRMKYLDFTTPYLSLPLAIATHKDEIFIENLDSVQTFPLSIVEDFAYIEILKKQYPNIQLIEVKNTLEGLRKVANHEVFGFIDTIGSIVYTIQTEGLTNVKIAGRFDEQWELSIGTRNDEPILNTIMQKALNNVSSSEIKQIYNAWNAIRFEQSIDYSLLIKVLIVSSLILFVFYIWNRRLQEEKKKADDAIEQLELVLESSRVGIWKLDIQKGISFNDRRMWKILGYERNDCEITIDEMSKIIHPDDLTRSMEVMQKCIEGDLNKIAIEFRAKRADGSYCWIHDTGQVTQRDKNGYATKIVGIAMDVSNLKMAQEQAERAKNANESLLRELYHRVKNNLQVISSFLSLQANHYDDPILSELLNESNLRIKAISLIHEQLYIAKDPTQVNIQQYLESLIIENLRLHSSYHPKWSLKAEELELSISNATLVGLIVNEILNNAFKHAFKSVDNPSIEFKFWKDISTNTIRLDVKDNGIEQTVKNRNKTLGMEIIEALTFQLEGTMNLNTQSGYHYEFTFPQSSLI